VATRIQKLFLETVQGRNDDPHGFLTYLDGGGQVMSRLIRYRFALALGVAAVAAALPAQTHAQGGPIAWENATELSFVSTGGNASSSTLGLKAAITGTGGANAFKLELGGIRGETNVTARTAIGTPSSFIVNETTTSQLTAESYFARGRYNRAFASSYAFSGLGWERNTFAGVQNRYSVVSGFGRTWVEGESGRFKTDLGATYTIQKDVDPDPGADDGFLGIRFSVDATRRVSDNTDFPSALVLDESVEETGDYRADWINSLSVSLSERLAFKTALQLIFDNRPSNLRVPLFDGAGAPTGTNVLTPGDKLDNVVTLTLVIKL
jgi:putative salt-induced outer membrane protein YdiY